MEEVVNLAALEGSVDFSMFGMFLKSDWVVKEKKSFATTSYGEGEQEI